jgi:hypothetical protein
VAQRRGRARRLRLQRGAQGKVLLGFGRLELRDRAVTQKTILDSLRNYATDEDWGHPNTYDLKISRTGAGLETSYALTALPHKAMTKKVEDAMNKDFPDVHALLTGDDPFQSAK